MEINRITFQFSNMDTQKFKDIDALFSYPLGNSNFSIQYARSLGGRYFDFFKQLSSNDSISSIFYISDLINDVDTIIGYVFIINRLINNQPVYYICNLKIHPQFKHRNLYKKLFDFIKEDLKFHKITNLIAVSMNTTQGRLFSKHAKSIFNIENIELEKRYLHTFNLQQFLSFQKEYPTLYNQYYLVSNQGKKDIVVNNPMNLFHMVHSSKKLSSPLIYRDIVGHNPIVMLVDFKDHSYVNEQVQEISLIHNGISDDFLSSAEI